MEFLAAILFLVLYFVRPQDWVPGLEGLNVIKPIIAMGVVGLISRERRVPRWRWMSTPHEWVMIAYVLHGVYLDPVWDEAFSAVFPVVGFFFLTSQALNTEERLDKYFLWWAGCVTLMCVIGVLTDMGIDITKARDYVDRNLGRLCLNTYLLNNPNAMGHTAATAFPLVFFALVFRRDIGAKVLAIPMFMMIGQSVVATESKGAYMSSAAAIVAALMIGRSFLVQIIVGCLLFIGGSAATSALPRMADTTAMQLDEGIMGRALAFDAARSLYKFGPPAGWNRFQAIIPWEGEEVEKSTHSSFVQVGADQGPVGLFLYLAVIGCALRSLLTMRTSSDVLERARGVIFALIVGFCVSGWMINRSYHSEYFLMMGAVVAFHKLARERKLLDAGMKLTEEDESPGGEAAASVPVFTAVPSGQGGGIEVREDERPWKKMWNRFGLIDFGIAYGLLYVVVWFWDYLIDFFVPK